MNTTKPMDKIALKNAYIHFLLNQNERPKNVFVFANELSINEADFYQFFASFESIEADVIATALEETITTIETEGKTDPKQALAQLYHSYFHKLTENRSLMLILLNGGQKNLQNLKKLTQIRTVYLSFIRSINLQISDFGNHTIGQIMHKSVAEVSWGQFIFTLNFWINDSSENFEKTHILIDKCINTGFDLLNKSTIESIVDLGQFLFTDPFKTH